MSDFYFKISSQKLKIEKPKQIWSFERRPGGWWIATDGVKRVRLTQSFTQGKLQSLIDGKSFFGEWIAASQSRGKQKGSDADLKAQFPGKVRKILVKIGETVKEGQPLLVIEAMKMEFQIKAPYSGLVEKIRVTESQQLIPGDLFLDLKESKVEEV